MNIADKRRLLATIETLVKWPASATEETMATVLLDLDHLFSELCDQPILVVAVTDSEYNRQINHNFQSEIENKTGTQEKPKSE